MELKNFFLNYLLKGVRHIFRPWWLRAGWWGSVVLTNVVLHHMCYYLCLRCLSILRSHKSQSQEWINGAQVVDWRGPCACEHHGQVIPMRTLCACRTRAGDLPSSWLARSSGGQRALLTGAGVHGMSRGRLWGAHRTQDLLSPSVPARVLWALMWRIRYPNVVWRPSWGNVPSSVLFLGMWGFYPPIGKTWWCILRLI